MALARARMAISHCCKGIRQISVRRFATEPGQTTHTANDGSIPPGPSRLLKPFFHPVVLLGMTIYAGFDLSYIYLSKRERQKTKESLRESLEGYGVSRESCEANIANIKQVIESGSATQHDRYWLKRNEEWLELFPKGT